MAIEDSGEVGGSVNIVVYHLPVRIFEKVKEWNWEQVVVVEVPVSLTFCVIHIDAV